MRSADDAGHHYRVAAVIPCWRSVKAHVIRYRANIGCRRQSDHSYTRLNDNRGIRLASGSFQNLTRADAEAIRNECSAVQTTAPVINGGAQSFTEIRTGRQPFMEQMKTCWKSAIGRLLPAETSMSRKSAALPRYA